MSTQPNDGLLTWRLYQTWDGQPGRTTKVMDESDAARLNREMERARSAYRWRLNGSGVEPAADPAGAAAKGPSSPAKGPEGANSGSKATRGAKSRQGGAKGPQQAEPAAAVLPPATPKLPPAKTAPAEWRKYADQRESHARYTAQFGMDKATPARVRDWLTKLKGATDSWRAALTMRNVASHIEAGTLHPNLLPLGVMAFDYLLDVIVEPEGYKAKDKGAPNYQGFNTRGLVNSGVRFMRPLVVEPPALTPAMCSACKAVVPRADGKLMAHSKKGALGPEAVKNTGGECKGTGDKGVDVCAPKEGK